MLSQNTNLFANVCAERTKRSSNFSTKEVNHLLHLVDKRKEIIESKKTDRTTSEEKVKAWMEIEEEFNSIFEDYRSIKVLKTKYENLKKNLKRKLPTNVSNLSVLKIMQSNENSMGNEYISYYDHTGTTDDEETFPNSNISDIDVKPQTQLNESELDAAAEEYVFETFLFGEAQTSSQKNQIKAKTIPPLEQSHAKIFKKKAIDIWEQIAHKKLKKLDIEIEVISEEWKLKKLKLELEIENVKVETRYKEEKLKLELELMRQQLANKTAK